MFITGASTPLPAEFSQDLIARIDSGRALLVVVAPGECTVLDDDDGEGVEALFRHCLAWGLAT